VRTCHAVVEKINNPDKRWWKHIVDSVSGDGKVDRCKMEPSELVSELNENVGKT
jgi:hypothetical protein